MAQNFKTRLAKAEQDYRDVLDALPASREKSMVLTKLDEARCIALDFAQRPETDVD